MTDKELGKLDLKTLEHIKFTFELYSDHSCRTLGYDYIKRITEQVKKLNIDDFTK